MSTNRVLIIWLAFATVLGSLPTAYAAADALPPPSSERLAELRFAKARLSLPLKRAEVFRALGGIEKFRSSCTHAGKDQHVEEFFVFDPTLTFGTYVVQLAYRMGSNAAPVDEVVTVRFIYVSPYGGEFVLEPMLVERDRANQSLEPTATGVTPPAGAGDRAAGSRGSP